MNTQRSASDSWSIARVLAWAASDFRARGIATGRLDAELLLAHAVGLDRVGLIRDAERTLGPAELEAYREFVKRRRQREPVAYILGEREFYGLPFRVDRRVLIPRPDTECLVEVALKRTADRSLYGRALDLCTGSGCVAIAFAKRRPTWRVTGLDISAEALDLARENAARNNVLWSVSFTRGDLLDDVSPVERYELITANPPYIPDQELSALEPEITAFEPELAIAGGADGLVFIRRLLARAPEFLTPGGVCAVEVHFDQAGRVAELFHAAGFAHIETIRDYAGHERVVSGAHDRSP